MKGKEKVIDFLSKLLPDDFKFSHISATFGEDDSLIISIYNCAPAEDGEKE